MQKTGTKNKKQEQKHGTVKLSPVQGVCVLVRGTHMSICIHPHTSLQYLRNLPHILSCVRNMMLPLECSFRTISMLACGRLVLLATHFKVGLQLIGNDLAAFLAINPTGTSNNTDRVSYDTLCTYYRPVLFFNQ